MGGMEKGWYCFDVGASWKFVSCLKRASAHSLHIHGRADTTCPGFAGTLLWQSMGPSKGFQAVSHCTCRGHAMATNERCEQRWVMP